MKIISDVITDKVNCPVISYVPGGPYAGIYSAAVGIALACDKIYMAGHSTMGSVPPMAGSGSLEEHKLKYSPPALDIYGGYLSALAQQNGRIPSIAAAMVDDTMDVLLVKDTQGNTSYISRADRSPSQSIVKTVTKQDFIKVEDDQQQEQIRKKFTISLTASEAVEMGMADKVADSRAELLAALNGKDVNVVAGPDFKRDVKRFEANERNMNSIYASMEYLEQRIAELDQQIYQMSLRQDESTVTREYYRNEGRWSRFLGYEDSDDSPTDRDRYIGSSGRQREVAEREVVVEKQTIGITVEDLLFDLEIALSNLLDDYSAAINLANRYPGLLPVGVSVSDLQKKYDQASVMYDDLVIR
jgi:ClpP class serine protease